MALRKKNKLLFNEAAVYAKYLRNKRRQRKKNIPKPKDLITVRNQQLNNQKNKKLKPK